MNIANFLSVMILVFESLFMCQCESKSNNHHSNNEIIQNNNESRKDATFYGAATLKGGSFAHLKINGAGSIKDITAISMKINGAGTVSNSVIDDALNVNGGTTLNDVTVGGDFHGNGGVTINHGSFNTVTANGGITIKHAKIIDTVTCHGGIKISDTHVGGNLILVGGINADRSEFTHDLELSWSDDKATFTNCTVQGSITVKSNEESHGWFWRLTCWLSSDDKKQELVLKDTVIKGDVTFEEDKKGGKIVSLHGSSKIIGNVKGATIIQK